MTDDLDQDVALDFEEPEEDIEFEETAYLDEEIEDLAKDDPDLLAEVDLEGTDDLDDSDAEVDEAPEAGKTDSADPAEGDN